MTRSARGFTLLEVIVATAVMSVAVVGLLALLTTVLSNAARVRQYDRAAMLGRAKMNELLADSALPLGRPMAGQWDDSAGWRAVAAPFERWPEAQPGSWQLVRIELEIWWKEGEERKSVKLEGYRRGVVRLEEIP